MQEKSLYSLGLGIGKLLKFVFGLLIIINVLSFNRTGAFDYKSFCIQVIFCALFFLAGIGIIKDQLSIAKNYLNNIIILFVCLNLISFIASPYKIASGIKLFDVFIYAGVYFIFLSAFSSIADINRFINVLVFSLFLTSAHGVLQHFKFDFLRISNQAVFSAFINPNFFAGFLAISLPFAWGKLFMAKKNLKELFYSFACLVIILTLILTGSKGGILTGILGTSFFLALSICAFLQTRIVKHPYRQRFLIVTLILTIVLVIALGGIFLWCVHGKDVLASLKERHLIGQVVLKMIKDSPLKGRGIGTFALFAPLYKEGLFHHEQFIRHAWNEFLELWAELGILGMIAFITILTLASLSTLKLIFRNNQDRDERIIGISGLSSLWAGIVLNLGEVNLRIVYLGIYFWLSLAILAKIRELNLKNPIFQIRLSPFGKGVGFVTVIALFLFSLKYAFTPLIMYKAYENRPLSSTGEEDFDQALEHFEKAIQDDPQSISAYNNLGNVYLYLGDIDKAIEYYRKAIDMNSRYVSAHYNLGYVYYLQGRILEAYKQFELCLKLNPKDIDSFFMLKRRILY